MPTDIHYVLFWTRFINMVLLGIWLLLSGMFNTYDAKIEIKDIYIGITIVLIIILLCISIINIYAIYANSYQGENILNVMYELIIIIYSIGTILLIMGVSKVNYDPHTIKQYQIGFILSISLNFYLTWIVTFYKYRYHRHGYFPIYGA